MSDEETPPVAPKADDALRERVAELEALFPEFVSEGRVDLEKVQAFLGSNVSDTPERYQLNWAGKRDAMGILQAPRRGALAPRKEESINFDETGHAFVEGENLEVLKLLYKAYFGRIKMIYIDPPFNTGNDFIYSDNFADPLENYLKFTRQMDASGNLLTSNPETSGRFHSAWLSMMYPRLFVARQLLRDDGMIFVSIDDHELHDLRLILNELFGEESFAACFVWQRRQKADSRTLDRASTDHEYVVAYRNPKAALRGEDIDVTKFTNPDNDSRGPWFSADLTGLATKEQRPNLHYSVTDPKTGIVYPPSPTRGWSISNERFQKNIAEDRIIWPSKPSGRPRLKKFLNEVRSFQTGFSTILDVGYTTDGTREIQAIFGEKIIQFPKPVGLIKSFVRQATSGDDIVLDFFAGTCPTAEAVWQANREDGGKRRVVLVQLPEPTGRADFRTIAAIGKERMRRAIRAMNSESRKQARIDPQIPEDLGFRVFSLVASSFRQWDETKPADAHEYQRQLALMVDPLKEGWDVDTVLWEVALREGYSLASRTTVIESVTTNTVYRISNLELGQTFTLCLDPKLSPETVKQLGLRKTDLFICRDAALDDEIAANVALQCYLKTL